MSIRIFRDVEEALAREVRRITFSDTRTVNLTVLQENFDPITGELVPCEVEPSFYDSSADARHAQWPDFFIKLLRTREDRFTGRMVPPYNRELKTSVKYSPKAFEIIIQGSDGTISSPGTTLTTTQYQIKKIQVGYYLRLLNGNNVGTYVIDSITPSAVGPHTITVSNDLVLSLPEIVFQSSSREVTFLDNVDLNTVQPGDTFEDANFSAFPISAVDAAKGRITLGGLSTPDSNSGGKIVRTGNVFKNSDPSLVRFMILDPSKPLRASGIGGDEDISATIQRKDWAIPIDAFYMIRIDSKARENHIDILNRIWEEYNPPRTGLPVVIRSPLSAEQLLTEDVTSGGSTTIKVSDNSNYEIGDSIFIFDNLSPTRDECGNFQRPFESVIIDKSGTTDITLEDTVPDTYGIAKESRIVSNAQFCIWMFHFVNHFTRDNEGAQYWSHEFTFWVQLWVDKQGLPKDYTTISDTGITIEDEDSNILGTDP